MKKLGLSLAAGVALIVVPALLVTLWHNHQHPLVENSRAVIQNNAQARALLGDAITAGIWIDLKVSERRGRASASYRVSGSRGSARAEVSARLTHDQWQFNWIWLRQEDGRYVTVLDRRAPPR